MSRIRVVHLLPSTDDAGAENQARYLLRELGDYSHGMELELVYFREGRAHDHFVDLGLPMRHVTPRANLTLDGRRRARRLRDLYPGRPPDVLHTWMYEANVVAARIARHWPSTCLVMTERSGNGHRSDLRQVRTMRRVYPRADHVLANSEDGVSLSLDVGCDPSRVSIVPNVVQPERTQVTRLRAEVRRELRIASDNPLVCAVGRPDWRKDFPTLLRAMELVHARLPAVRLVLAGPTMEEFARLGIELPPYALALGWVDHPADVMAASDVVAHSSATDGHSNVADEALMLGLPFVCTDVGAHPALVRRAHGRVVPVGDAARLASAIFELLQRPPDAESILRAVSRELAPRNAAQTTIATYRWVLAKRGRPWEPAVPAAVIA